jgi:hypothetical protein
METLRAFIDWGRDEQVVRLRLDDEVVMRKVKHDAKAYRELCDWLLERVEQDPSRVELALERPDGPLVNLAFAYGFQVMAINPKQLSRLRDAYRHSSAKTDETDTEDGLRALEREPECFRLVSPPTAETYELRRVTRHRKKLVSERTSLQNRLKELIWGYFPAFDKLGSWGSKWMRQLWWKIQTPEQARGVRPAAVRALLKQNRVRSFTAEGVLETLRSPALPTLGPVVQCSVFEVGQVLDQLELLHRQIGECDRKMKQLLEQLADSSSGTRPSDVAILGSLPAVGPVVLATLFGEASELIEARCIEGLRRLGGSAPVTRQTGKQKASAQRWGTLQPQVGRRLATNPYLRDAFFHWGEKAMQKSPHYKAAYSAMRRRGHTHGRACRQVADQLLTVAAATLRDGTLYDPSLHGATRRREPPSAVGQEGRADAC